MRLVLSLLIAVVPLIGGCSLVVDFDRSLLLDGGPDGGIDASIEGGIIPFDEDEDEPSASEAD
jgi:hypothetical protein